jgi:predicted XRE-type DNA-binding protein
VLPKSDVLTKDQSAPDESQAVNAASGFRISNFMSGAENTAKKMSRLNRYVQSLCGLYSRVARRFGVDRSYVSRVARGERHSQEIERALSTEFSRVTKEQA